MLELLVVVVVIALLMALLLPALSRAQGRAHEIGCLNNERQLLLDFRTKLEDEAGTSLAKDAIPEWIAYDVGVPNTGWVCPAAPPRKNRPHRTWREDFHPAVNAAWQVRNWALTVRQYRGWEDVTNLPPARLGSYGFNEWLQDAERLWRPPLPEPPRWRRFYTDETEIADAARTPVIGDSVRPFVRPEADTRAPTDLLYVYEPSPATEGAWSWLGPDFPNECAIPRHGRLPLRLSRTWPPQRPLPGAVNIGFWDGHAELVPLDRLWQLYWHRGYHPPPRRPGLW